MFVLTKSCRLDKNLVDLTLQSLLLLGKNNENYFPSLDVSSSLDFVRDLFVLSAFESAELIVAEDELTEIRNDKRLKMKQSTDMASFQLSLSQE
jgi:hypothetical protein